MRKWTIIGLILLLTAAFLTGCSDEAPIFEAKTYTAEGTQVQTMQINVKDRRVEIVASEDENITIEYSESEKEAYEITLSEDQILTMTYKANKEWTDFIGGKTSVENRTVRLQIPDALLSSLKISTTNEDIVLSKLKLKNCVEMEVNNGNIQFERLDVGKECRLTAKNGNIDGTVNGSYDDFTITSEVKKGESNLPEKLGAGEKTLAVAVNNGDIDVQINRDEA